LINTGFAQQDTTRKAARKAWQEKRKARFDSLSPEKKKAIRNNLKQRYDDLSPEDQQKVKEAMMKRLDSPKTGEPLLPKKKKQTT
jgi:hypothetical protein